MNNLESIDNKVANIIIPVNIRPHKNSPEYQKFNEQIKSKGIELKYTNFLNDVKNYVNKKCAIVFIDNLAGYKTEKGFDNFKKAMNYNHIYVFKSEDKITLKELARILETQYSSDKNSNLKNTSDSGSIVKPSDFMSFGSWGAESNRTYEW
jgi:hypothetical protein